MSYHDLSECTLTPDERLKEAVDIIDMLENGYSGEFSQSERSMMYSVVRYQSCSVKQLFWLRDIKDKYL